MLPAAAGLLAFLVLPAREPVYEGKTLTAWLEQYVGNSTNYMANQPLAEKLRLQNESKAAIRQIGSNAVPTLLKMASKHDFALKTKLTALLLRVFPYHPRTAGDYHNMACLGFYALGPLGKDAVPPLIDLVKNQPFDINCVAADCLGNIGPDAGAAVPVLVKLMDDTNRIVRWDATINLGRIHMRPELAVPVLVDQLSATNRNNAVTILALGEYGKDAKPAFPAVMRFVTDQEQLVRFRATNALKQIDPAAAAAAGIH